MQKYEWAIKQNGMYHKWIIIGCLATSIGGGITACENKHRHDASTKEVPATSIPYVENDEMPYTVKGLKDNEGGTSFFAYHKGKMTGGYGTAYGSFTITESPLRITVSTPTNAFPAQTDETVYSNFYVTSGGYVTAMDFKGHKTQSVRGIPITLFYGGHTSVTYNTREHVDEIRYDFDDSQGYGETGRIHYEWDGGKLTNIFYDASRKRHFYEQHKIFTFHYTEKYEPTTKYDRIFLKEMNLCPFIYDFMWYAGLFGRPLEEIPVGFTCESMGDEVTGNITETISVERDLAGRTNALRYKNGATSLFIYEEKGQTPSYSPVLLSQKKHEEKTTP